MVFLADDLTPGSMIHFKRIYSKDRELHENQTFYIDVQVDDTLVHLDSDGIPDYYNGESRTVVQSHEYEKECIFGGDDDQIVDIVYSMLDLLGVSYYTEIVTKLTDTIVELKKRHAISELPIVEGLEVSIEIEVIEDDDDHHHHHDGDVKLAVAPASDEAMETHLETVDVVENESYCVICIDKIGLDETAGRMPCSHVFHRTCGEEWLRSSGICPVCRAVFPS